MKDQNLSIPELGQGVVTIEDIRNLNTQYVNQLTENFNTNSELINRLNTIGSLKLYKAELYLDENFDKVAFCFDKLILEDTNIYIRSNNISIICNEYVQRNSTIHSFEEAKLFAEDGKDATNNGNDGKDGKDGNDSGNAYVFVTSKILAAQSGIKYLLNGQNGGKGGNGAKGIKGTNGSGGRNCRNGDLPGDCRRGPGNGKDGKKGKQGGDAGNGGDGGDGGTLEFKIISNSPYSSFFKFSGNQGIGNIPGYPGLGGDGGDGGKPGRSNCSRCDRPRGLRSGRKGPQGEIGNYGSKGDNGTGSILLRRSYNIRELNSFLNYWNRVEFEIQENIQEFKG